MSNCAAFPDAGGIRPIKYNDGVLSLIDQRLLPTEEVWLEYTDYQAVAEAIRSMVVRGAPAIGVTAAYGALFGARAIETEDYAEFVKEFDHACEVLGATRPTAARPPRTHWAGSGCGDWRHPRTPSLPRGPAERARASGRGR